MRKKSRGNGSGSISFLKDGRKKPYIVFEPARYTVDENNKLHKTQKRIGSFATRKEAEQCLALWNMSADEKINYYKDTKTFGAIYDEYIEHRKSLDSNANMFTIKKVRPKFAKLENLSINKLIYKELQDIINEQTPTMGKQCRQVLRNVYKYALKMNYVEKNIAELLEIAKIPKARERNLFTADDVKLFWNLLESGKKLEKKYSRVLLVLLYSGMRINELMKMKVEDVHFDDNYMIGGSKTDAGINRVIPIHHKIKPIIKYYLKTTPNNKLVGFDFRTDYMQNVVVSLSWFLQERLNLDKHHTSHDCRATFLTQFYRQKLDWVIAEKITGHSIKNMGLDVYVKFSTNDLLNELNQMDYFYGSNRE